VIKRGDTGTAWDYSSLVELLIPDLPLTFSFQGNIYANTQMPEFSQPGKWLFLHNFHNAPKELSDSDSSSVVGVS